MEALPPGLGIVVAGVDAAKASEAIGQHTARGHRVEVLTGVADLVRRCARSPLPDCVVLSQEFADGSALDALAALAPCIGSAARALPVVVLVDCSAPLDTGCRLRAGAQELLVRDALTPAALARAIDTAIVRGSMAGESRHRHGSAVRDEARHRSLANRATVMTWWGDAAAECIDLTPSWQDYRAQCSFRR